MIGDSETIWLLISQSTLSFLCQETHTHTHTRTHAVVMCVQAITPAAADGDNI